MNRLIWTSNFTTYILDANSSRLDQSIHIKCCLSFSMWFYAFVMAGSHGFCGWRGSESPPDLLVHSEIRQRESSASVLWTYLSMTLHSSLTKMKRRKRLYGGKYCVAACIGVSGWYITKDHPGIVEHDTEWLQTQLTSQQRHLWAERWVDGSVMSITQGHTLIRNRKWISWSWHVKTMSK